MATVDEHFVDQILVDIQVEEQKRKHNKNQTVIRKGAIEAEVVGQFEALAKGRDQQKLSGGAGTCRLRPTQTMCTPSPHAPLLHLAPQLRNSAY